MPSWSTPAVAGVGWVKGIPRGGGAYTLAKGNPVTKYMIVLFNLRPGQTAADYEQWARANDAPAVRRLPSVKRYELLKTAGLLGPGIPPYQYVEIVEISDFERLRKDAEGEEIGKIAAIFQSFAQDPVMLLLDRID